MKAEFLTALAVFILPVAATAAPKERSTEAELQSVTQAMLDAVAPGDRSVWEEQLHPDFVRLDENGGVTSGAELLDELEPLPPGLDGRMAIENFTATVKGDTAIAIYSIQENLNYHGQKLRSRFRSMDTWIETPNGWRLLGQHVAAELKDPPPISLPPSVLCAYAGVYELTDAITTEISCTENGLRAARGDRPPVAYLAETADVFFAPGRPRSRRLFLRDAAGDVVAFVDRREGEDVRWRRRR